MTSLTYLYSTDRIGLRPLSATELNGPYPDWFLDEEVNRFNSHFRLPSNADSISEFINGLAGDKSRLVLAVYALDRQVHIGNISLQQIDHFNHSAEMAFLFGNKAYWGQGIGQEAAEVLMKHGQQYLAIRRYTLGCLAENLGMNKLATKLKFVQEGTLQKALWHDGQYRDVNLYGKNIKN